jgi:D-alanyl-D-alanine carboxypeptidase (penicillin-binding protein 5/6)
MIQGMRQAHRDKKKKHNLALILLVLNILLWGSAIYLWLQDYESAPMVTRQFTYEHLIETPVIEAQIFNVGNVELYDEVGFSMYSDHALLINVTTGDVLFAHKENERVYPASITKIMTVLVGLEYADDEDLIVQADFAELFLANAAMAGFEYGETRTLSEVLHGSMLPSGADATTTLAYHVGGSYEAFVDLMNETAMRLGMFDTHFTNASGLHDDNHYTTAYDIGLMLEYALEIEAFKEIFMTPTYAITTRAGNEHVMRSTMFNSIATIGRMPEFSGGEILGGKDGFTLAAGLCLASLATDGVDEFILITLQAPPRSEIGINQPHVVDAFTIYEYFFNMQ